MVKKEESTMTDTSIPAETRIGHVHLKVANLERAIGFYLDYLGFDLLFDMGSAAFLSAGGYHFAINYPERKDLAVALKRLLDHGWSIDGASDHGTHEAIYLHDPDFNGIELAWDRHPSLWPRRDGAVTFSRQPLDFASLLAELGEPDEAGYLAVLSAYK